MNTKQGARLGGREHDDLPRVDGITNSPYEDMKVGSKRNCAVGAKMFLYFRARQSSSSFLLAQQTSSWPAAGFQW